MAIDLHTHSLASDGTGTPGQVVQEAVAAGLDTIALTDHDTTLGWDEAVVAAQATGLTLVRGIEISCARAGRSIHLLGYLTDPGAPELVAELARARESRVTRLDRIVERMSADGIPITVAEVRAQVGEGATFGRPHIADALVAAGVVPTRDEAFARWLHNDSPYYVSHYAPDPVRAVEVVRAAGGVAVVAHAWSGTRGKVIPDAWLEEFAAAGLAGLEVDHPDHDAAARSHLGEVVTSLGLVRTGSSDYHGTGKLNRLGEDTTSVGALEALEAQASGVEVVRP